MDEARGPRQGARGLSPDELALIIITGTSEENDAAQYRRNMNLLGQLAKHSKLKSVPVFFLGYKGDNYLQATCAQRGVAYLALPVRKSELVGGILVQQLVHGPSSPA
jgi:hypothetical protein